MTAPKIFKGKLKEAYLESAKPKKMARSAINKKIRPNEQYKTFSGEPKYAKGDTSAVARKWRWRNPLPGTILTEAQKRYQDQKARKTKVLFAPRKTLEMDE